MSWRSVTALLILAFAGGAAGFAWLSSGGGMPWAAGKVPVEAPAKIEEAAPIAGFATPAVIQPSASQAEAMLLVQSARRKIEAGQPLGDLGGRLQLSFGQTQPQALGVIANGVKQPISNVALLDEFDAISSDLSAPANTVWDRMQYELATLFVLRSPGAKPTASAMRTEQVRKLIISGDISSAAQLVQAMPGSAHADDWLEKANRAIAVHKALDTLNQTAIAPPPPPILPPETSAPSLPTLPPAAQSAPIKPADSF
jgi:hypothetical protein